MTVMPSLPVTSWQWWRLMNLLSICRSLSGVRPMTLRPGIRCSSATALPSVDNTTFDKAW